MTITDRRTLAKLPIFSFGGVKMRARRISVKGGIRDHVHEYPHSPGGQPEKLGRKLYVVTVDAVFRTYDRVFPKAWPDDITFVRSICESQRTEKLMLPTIGEFDAYARDWDIDQRAEVMNGEDMRLVLVEDQELDELVDIAFFPAVEGLSAKFEKFVLIAKSLDFKIDLFDFISAIVEQIQAAKDQVNLAEARIGMKAQQLADACRFADDSIHELNDPPFWPIVQALHDLGVAAGTLAKDSLFQFAPLGTYVTPARMTVAQISNAIYGNTSRAVEIMKLNPFENPYSVPPLFPVQYYVVPIVGVAA